MTFSFGARNRAVAAIMFAATAVATVIFLSGCGRGANSDSPANADSASNSIITVELTQNQLSAIKIGPVGTYLFPIEKEAVGSVSFEEDPGIVQAEFTLLGAAATATVASNELVRAQSLYGTNGISQRELEQATSDNETGAAALKAAHDALRALGETDGQINQLLATGKIGSSPGTSSNAKWVVANVNESDSPLVREGQPVRVNVMALPDRVFDGKISKIYSLIDSNTHHMSVRCQIADPKDELRPGMLASVAIQIQQPLEAIAIPPNGVVREGDGTMTAWVTTDRQHFTQRIIKTGMREDGEVQILEGLQRGEFVVTDGAVFLDNMLQAPSDD